MKRCVNRTNKAKERERKQMNAHTGKNLFGHFFQQKYNSSSLPDLFVNDSLGKCDILYEEKVLKHRNEQLKR